MAAWFTASNFLRPCLEAARKPLGPCLSVCQLLHEGGSAIGGQLAGVDGPLQLPDRATQQAGAAREMPSLASRGRSLGL